jgi:periplasmic protein TonB
MTFTLLATPLRRAFAAVLTMALGLAGCGALPGSTGSVPGQLSSASAPGSSATPRASNAATPREYKQDAARHIYARNGNRIYAGKLPPLLYAIGTLSVSIDANGRVTGMNWMRAPKHAPEVIAEIERTVLSAAPYPAASRIGKLTWTDTWLWDKSGHFQLDTLTEGQLSQFQDPR